MNRCVGSKCNPNPGEHSGWLRRIQSAGFCLALSLGVVAPSHGTTDTSASAVAADAYAARPWRDQVWEYLELIFRVMGYTSPEATVMGTEEALAHLVVSWETVGMPPDLTPGEAIEAVETLSDLEVLLLAQPENFPAILRMEALATIASMREALLTDGRIPWVEGGDE